MKRIDRRSIGIACLLMLAAVLPASAAEPKPDRWEKDIAAFEAKDQQQPSPRDGIVFFGSSSIRMWKVADSFPNLPVINRGFGGSQYADAVRYADRAVLPCQPKAVVMYSGDNDLNAKKSPENVAADCGRLIEQLRKGLPQARLLVISIKPSIKRWTLEDKILAANRLIAQRVKADANAVFIDIHNAMLGSDGKPLAELYLADGLHMTAAGYAIWTKALLPHLEKR